MLFNVANVKVSIKVKSIPLNIVSTILKEKDIVFRLHNNFIVVKSKYTFIIFKPKNLEKTHINITKIPNIDSVNSAISEIENILDCTHSNLSVDNIIASCNLNKSLNLIEIVNNKIFEKIKYNNQKFPGLFVKFNIGTAIIFHSGKIVIVGCHKITDVEWITMKIIALI